MSLTKTSGDISSVVIISVACFVLPAIAPAQSTLLGWGSDVFDSGLNNSQSFVEVAAGYRHTVVRQSNGSVIGWGDNYNGQCNVAALPIGLTYVGCQRTAKTSHLRSNQNQPL